MTSGTILTSNLIGSDAQSITQMLIDAATEFYALLPEGFSELAHASVRSQILEQGTEFEHLYTLGSDEPVAIIAYYPTADVTHRKQRALRDLVRRLPSGARIQYLKAVSEHGHEISDVVGPGTYLSRVSVRQDRRGQGLGSMILRAYIEEFGRDVDLHVNVDAANAPALSLYSRHGFKIVSTLERRFVAMKRAYA